MKKTKKSAVKETNVKVVPVKPTFDRAFDRIYFKVERHLTSANDDVATFKDKVAKGNISSAIDWNSKSAIKGEYIANDLNMFMNHLSPTAVPESLESHASNMLDMFKSFVERETQAFVGDECGMGFFKECEPNCTNPFTNLVELYHHNARLQVLSVAKYIVYELKCVFEYKEPETEPMVGICSQDCD